MLDTVKLELDDFDATGAKMRVSPPDFETDTGRLIGNFMLYKDGDRWMHGKLAKHIDGHFEAKIVAVPGGKDGGFVSRCKVRFETSKFRDGHNFHPPSTKQAKAAFKVVQCKLSDIGIKTNVLDAKVCRVDACKNLMVDEPVNCYGDVFKVLQAKRMAQHGYPDGWLYENGMQELSFYDKILKMRIDDFSVDDLPKNVLRGEWRLKQARKVRAVLGFDDTRSLLNNLDHLQHKYQEAMHGSLFRYDVDEVHVMVASQIKEDLLFFKNMGRKFWLREYLMHFGLHQLQQQVDIAVIGEIVGELAESRATKSKLKAQLREARVMSQNLQYATGSQRTTGELYRELKRKIGFEN